MGGCIVTLTYVSTIYLRFTPPLFSLIPPPSLDKSRVFLYMITKYIYHICLPSPSVFILPWLVPTLNRTCFTGPILSFCTSFLKCILIIQGVSPWYFRHMSISCFNQINPPITFSLSTCSPIIQQFTAYLLTQMQCISILFIFYHSLFPLPPPYSLYRQTTNIIMFVLSLYVCIGMYIYIFV
jgi:hypothetical protein